MPPKRQLVQIEHDIQTRKRRSHHFVLDREIMINHSGHSTVTETKHYNPKTNIQPTVPSEEIACEENPLPEIEVPKASHKVVGAYETMLSN